MSSNIEVKLDVLNQKGSPALFASSLATRPAASFEGRLFVDSDNPSTGVYRDTGTAWIQIADAGAGTSGTLQQVTTNGNTSNIGISLTANGIGIGTTIPSTNRIDIHAASGIQATFNGTGTTNSALQLQSAGVGKWNVTNKYNSAANDFAITDVLNTLDRLTIKNTGQTFIGANTTSSGLFVVNSATSDNHIVILGANAPSLRFRNAGTGGILNTGIGISTATNNFIQGSASGDYCIFNSSTTPSPISFGIYNTGAAQTQEVARFNASGNLQIGTTSGGNWRILSYQNSSTGSANSSALMARQDGTDDIVQFWTSGSNIACIKSNGNLILNTTHDNGNKLQVNGNAYVAGNIGIGTTSPAFKLTVLDSGGASIVVGATSGNAYLYADDSAATIGTITSTPLRISTNSTVRMTIKNTGIINIASIPTSSSGLSSGDIYSNLGILTIVP
jgi:hypothetical protein